MRILCDICGNREHGITPFWVPLNATSYTHLDLDNRAICMDCCIEHVGVASFQDLPPEFHQKYVEYLRSKFKQKLKESPLSRNFSEKKSEA